MKLHRWYRLIIDPSTVEDEGRLPLVMRIPKGLEIVRWEPGVGSLAVELAGDREILDRVKLLVEGSVSREYEVNADGFQRVYLALGQGAGSILHRDGPWWCDDLEYLDKKLIPWLRERGCTDVHVAEVWMPPETYTMLGGSREAPR